MSANGGEIFIRLELDDGQFKVGVVNAGQTMREFKRTLDSTSESVKRLETVQSSMGRRFRDLVLTLGNLRFVAMDINDVFLRLPMSILKTAGELERLQTLMRGLSTETDSFKRTMEGVRDFNFVVGMAKNAPFEISALSDSFVKLKTAGIDPTNGSMQALVDSVARFGGNGDTLKRASVAIQQMAGKGVISMEELRQQLGEAVPTAMKEMADGMGMTMAELTKVVSTGTLSAKEALDKMLLQMRISNMGASADMMDTWVGMTSRLKTEWDLTAKAIADAGFGQAAKKAVSDLTSTLQSQEFMNFGKSMGASLGEAVNTIAELVRWIVRNGEEIKFLAQAWVAYKVVFSGIAPMAVGFRASMDSISNSMRANTATALRNVEANRQTMFAGTQAAFEVERARNRELATKLKADQQELASVQARNTAVIADERRLQGQLAAMRVSERKFNTNNIGDQQRTMRDIEALGRANAELNVRQRELNATVTASSAAYAASQRAMAVQLTTMGSLSAATRASQFATVAMTAASRAMGSVLNAMGGWVGVAITALTALYFVYQDLAGAAERYNTAVDQTKRGYTSKEDLEQLKGGLKGAESEYNQALAAQRNPRTNGEFPGVLRNKTAEERAADTKRLNEAAKKYREANEALTLGENNLIEETARGDSSANRLRIVRERGEIEAATAREIQRIESQRKESRQAMAGKTEKEINEVQKKFVDERVKIFQEGKRKEIAVEEKAASEAATRAARAGKGTAEFAAANMDLKAATESLKGLRGELEASERTVAAPIKILSDKGGKPKAVKVDPIEELLVKLRADRAELKAELDSFNDLDGSVNNAEAKIARIEKIFAGGKGAKGRKTNPDDPRLNEAKNEVREAEKLRLAIEARQKAAEGVQKTTAYIEQMRPAYEEAMEFLENPFDNTRRGGEERRLDRFFKRNEAALLAYAASVKKTVDEVKQAMRGDALAIDSSRAFSDMAAETVQINAGLVSNSQEAARLRAEADNERHRQEMQNLIDKRRELGAPEAELAGMQKTLDDNVTAKGAQIAQKFKTPMAQLLDEWTDTGKQMEKVSAQWLDRSADMLTDFVMTGKADFGSFAKSIIGDIVKIMSQQLLAKAVTGAMGFFGFANGGIMTNQGSVPLKKYASGGIARSPQLALYGEGDKPEAYVPLPDGRTIPVTLQGGGGSGGGNNVVISINVSQGGGEDKTSEGAGAAAYQRMSDRVREVVLQELGEQRRPGGMLYS